MVGRAALETPDIRRAAGVHDPCEGAMTPKPPSPRVSISTRMILALGFSASSLPLLRGVLVLAGEAGRQLGVPATGLPLTTTLKWTPPDGRLVGPARVVTACQRSPSPNSRPDLGDLVEDAFVDGQPLELDQFDVARDGAVDDADAGASGLRSPNQASCSAGVLRLDLVRHPAADVRRLLPSSLDGQDADEPASWSSAATARRLGGASGVPGVSITNLSSVLVVVGGAEWSSGGLRATGPPVLPDSDVTRRARTRGCSGAPFPTT
jgi:hypothetical protein